MSHAEESGPAKTPREPTSPAAKGVKRTRVSGAWVAVVIALVILTFLLIFIVQNLDAVTVRFLGRTGSLPLAVALLFSAIASAVLVALVGAARILQLRKATRRAQKSPH